MESRRERENKDWMQQVSELKRQHEEDKIRTIKELESANAIRLKEVVDRADKKEAEVVKSRERLAQLEREVSTLKENNRVLK